MASPLVNRQGHYVQPKPELPVSKRSQRRKVQKMLRSSAFKAKEPPIRWSEAYFRARVIQIEEELRSLGYK